MAATCRRRSSTGKAAGTGLFVVIPSLDLVVVRLGPSPGGSERYLNGVVAGAIEALGLESGR